MFHIGPKHLPIITLKKVAWQSGDDIGHRGLKGHEVVTANATCINRQVYQCRPRGGDQMDVVGHQAVTVDGQTEPFGLPCEYFQIDAAVIMDEEDVLAVIAALGNVMWAVRHDDSGYSWHSAEILPATSRPPASKNR